MKKAGRCLMSFVLVLLMAGCEGLYNSTPKDMVMVKVIPQEQHSDIAEYGGVLSMEAAKTLSMNAVNKYYGRQLTLNELQFELRSIDKSKFMALIRKPEWTDTPLHRVDLDTMTGSFFSATMTVNKSKEVYELILNDTDGDIVKISKSEDVPIQNVTDDSYIQDKALTAANNFVENKINYPLTELQLRSELTQWKKKSVTIFYTSKDAGNMKFGITLNFANYEITGFSKDDMALISYYSVGP